MMNIRNNGKNQLRAMTKTQGNTKMIFKHLIQKSRINRKDKKIYIASNKTMKCLSNTILRKDLKN